jgi:hypothetical protein
MQKSPHRFSSSQAFSGTHVSCPVHGAIEMSALEKAIMDSPPFQPKPKPFELP